METRPLIQRVLPMAGVTRIIVSDFLRTTAQGHTFVCRRPEGSEWGAVALESLLAQRDDAGEPELYTLVFHGGAVCADSPCVAPDEDGSGSDRRAMVVHRGGEGCS